MYFTVLVETNLNGRSLTLIGRYWRYGDRNINEFMDVHEEGKRWVDADWYKIDSKEFEKIRGLLQEEANKQGVKRYEDVSD